MADQHITGITNDPLDGACNNSFGTSSTWIIDSYTPGEWDGVAGTLCSFYSETSGVQATLNISAIGDISVKFVSFTDINVIGGTITADQDSIDGGNYTNIDFIHALPDQHITGITNDPLEGICNNSFATSATVGTWIIDTYTEGEWNGIEGTLCYFYSDTVGQQAILCLSAIGDVSASYMNFRDIYVVGGSIYADLTCVNGGNNFNITFATIPPISGYTDQTVIKDNYITVTGPKSIRYSQNRKLSLSTFLPSIYKSGDVERFIEIFEDYLNTLFEGSDGIKLTEQNLTISGSYIQNLTTSAWSRDDHYNFNTSAISADGSVASEITLDFYSPDQKISILEKIYRLPEYANPDLIDINFVQLLASNLGYKINMYRNEAGGYTNELGVIDVNSTTSGSDVDLYLRYFTSNIPNWISTKTTRNSITVLLRSYGLAGDIATFYTNNYETIENGGNWIIDYNNDLSVVPNDYYPTSHFGIGFNLDDNTVNITSDVVSRMASLRAIESVRPANTVFRGMIGNVDRTISIGVRCQVKMQKYIRIQ